MLGRKIQQVEDLQDYQRDREGEVIIVNGNPLLVVNFGMRYKGANPERYVLENACYIPVDYTVFLKWEADEICFMTRQLPDLVEYQFIYLPASSCKDDFTVLVWTSDLPSLWDQLLSILETQGPDMSIFKLGPWALFGVTSKEVQTRIVSAVREKVAGILHCAGWDNVTTFTHYAEYLGVHASDKGRFDWLVTEMMNENLPLNVTRHVSEQKVYWVLPTGSSTWKHPLYDKYFGMLTSAREKRVLNHWKSITIFQLQFLSLKFENLETLLEIARIFKINESFLIPIVRRIFAHFAAITEITVETSGNSVDDFARIIDFERNNFRPNEASIDENACLCIECVQRPATILCCDKFCQPCFDKVHATGRRKFHQWRAVSLVHCAECTATLASVHCASCKDAFCPPCFAKCHARGTRQTHTVSAIATTAPVSQRLPTDSPWIKLRDACGVPIFANFLTREQQRDPPLTF